MNDRGQPEPYDPPRDLAGNKGKIDLDDDPLPRRMNFQAIAGLVAGPVIAGPLGIVLSAMALKQINAHPDIYFGRGAAIAGIVVGSFATLWQALWLWALIAS